MELRGLEPLTSSMPWWAGRRRRRAASVDGVQGRAGAANTRFGPGAPQFAPHASNGDRRDPVAEDPTAGRVTANCFHVVGSSLTRSEGSDIVTEHEWGAYADLT